MLGSTVLFMQQFSRLRKIFTIMFSGLTFLAIYTIVISALHAEENTFPQQKETYKQFIKLAQKAEKNGNQTAAEVYYYEAIEANPQSPQAPLELSHLFIKLRRLQEAFDTALQISQAFPLNARAQATMGLVLIRSGNFQNAFGKLETALKLDNHDDLAIAAIAEAAYYENKLEESNKLIETAIYLNPTEPDYYLLKARVSSRLQQYKLAAQALKDFLDISPKTDADRRERIQGVINFYKYIGNSNIHVVQSKEQTSTVFSIHNRRPYIELKINGKGPFTFVVDTGAGISVLSLKTAHKLGINTVAKGGKARAIGGLGTFPILYGLLDNIEIGTTKIKTVPVYIREISEVNSLSKSKQIDGFLGLSILTEFLVTLDYEKKLMSLSPASSSSATSFINKSNSTVVQFRITDSGLISIQAQLDDGHPLHFIVDSGASTSIISTDSVEQLQWQHKILPNEKIKISGGAGTVENVNIMLAKSVCIADLFKPNVRMPVINMRQLNESTGFEQGGILGGDFLLNCRVQIDFRNQNLILTPIASEVLRCTNTQAEICPSSLMRH